MLWDLLEMCICLPAIEDGALIFDESLTSTRAWIQSEHSERQERVAYEGASTAEVLVGLPYQ